MTFITKDLLGSGAWDTFSGSDTRGTGTPGYSVNGTMGGDAPDSPAPLGTPGGLGTAGQIEHAMETRTGETSWSEQIQRYLRANPDVIGGPGQRQPS